MVVYNKIYESSRMCSYKTEKKNYANHTNPSRNRRNNDVNCAVLGNQVSFYVPTMSISCLKQFNTAVFIHFHVHLLPICFTDYTEYTFAIFSYLICRLVVKRQLIILSF